MRKQVIYSPKVKIRDYTLLDFIGVAMLFSLLVCLVFAFIFVLS